MGEKRRKREAVLNGPCPCNSQKVARRCCFNGNDWHKRPIVLGLRSLPASGRVDKCYMKELGSCLAPISGEHIISASVCKVLMGNGSFSISGVPWLEADETTVIAPPTANCLCRAHNSILSPLDDAANVFFASLRSFLSDENGSRHALVSGHDIERWILKTAKAASAARYLARGRERLSGIFSIDAAILDMIDDPRHWPDGAGLYCTMPTGTSTEDSARFQMQPLSDVKDEIVAMAVNVMGIRFVLLLEQFDAAKHVFLTGAKFRPARVVVSYPETSTNWLTMSWEDGKHHEHLTLHWLRKV